MLVGNQYFNLTTQLESGVRMIQAQGHRDPNGGSDSIRLCHFNCALMDGGSLDTYLHVAKNWLEDNPDECEQLYTEPWDVSTLIKASFSSHVLVRQRGRWSGAVGESFLQEWLRRHLLYCSPQEAPWPHAHTRQAVGRRHGSLWKTRRDFYVVRGKRAGGPVPAAGVRLRIRGRCNRRLQSWRDE